MKCLDQSSKEKKKKQYLNMSTVGKKSHSMLILKVFTERKSQLHFLIVDFFSAKHHPLLLSLLTISSKLLVIMMSTTFDLKT